MLKNYTSISSLPAPTLKNISASIGVQVQALANKFSLNTTGISNLKLGCLSCNATGSAPQSSVIEGFVANGTLTKAAFLKNALANHLISNATLKNIGTAVAQNATLLKQLVSNYTPSGFRPAVNTSIISQQNATAYVTKWLALGNSSSSYVNISAYKTIASGQNLSSIPLAQRIAAAYIKNAFNKTNIVNRTVVQQMYVSQVISGNKTLAKYTPSNVTVYGGVNATVVSMTNVGSGFNIQVPIPKTTALIRNVSFSTKANFTASAISIKTLANVSGVIPKTVPKPFANVASYLSVNSSISDPSLNSVNYTFNLSRSFVQQHRVNISSISMYRYNSTTQTWQKLVAKLVSSNATTYVFTAKSPGMSVYAVAYNTTPNATTTATVASVPTTTVAPSTAAAAQQPALSSTAILGIGAAALAAVIIVVVLYLYLRRRSGPKPA